MLAFGKAYSYNRFSLSANARKALAIVSSKSTGTWYASPILSSISCVLGLVDFFGPELPSPHI